MNKGLEKKKMESNRNITQSCYKSRKELREGNTEQATSETYQIKLYQALN